MAEVEKHTNGAILMLMKHNERKLTNDSNVDIIKERSKLNYSIPLSHDGLTDREYYQQLIDDSYIYGRGSKREDEAITSFSWVITLPKEVSDYTIADKNSITYLNYKEEKEFFEGAVRFVSERYGAENVFHNKIHYDEAKKGQPHIHIYVCPRKEIDHDKFHYKTKKINHAVKTESGRYEYTYRFIEDENGERIPLKNYAKMSDYYDYKLANTEILNRVELQHFHPDFQEFLRKNNLPGASGVYTGTTGGVSLSIKQLKDFTAKTGLTLDEAKTLVKDNEILQQQVENLQNQIVEITHSMNAEIEAKDNIITNLLNEKSVTKDAPKELDTASTWGNNEWGTVERTY